MGSSDHFTDSDLWVSFKMNGRLEKPEDSKSELINHLSGSYCIVTRWTNDSKNPKTRNRWTNSSTEALGWCACATERITPRNDSFFSSLIKDLFKTDPSLATSARAAKESGSYLCASNVTPTVVRFIVSVFLCLLCSCRMSSTTNDMFALSEKSAEKKTKTARLPIAHFKQKPAGSDLWPVNRCIPS